MNIYEFADDADTSLDDQQRAEIEKKDAIRLRIMVHGGDPEVSERLPGGRTKREQIRAALEALPFVGEALFALRIMVHGGDPEVSERLPGGSTKREQIRAALEALPYVGEALFALAPALEADLFDKCDGTIILIERNAEQRGARYELALHAGQRNAARKLFVLIPDDDRVPELEGDGFLATLVRERVKPLHRARYSDREYQQCRLVNKARNFVEGLKVERYQDLAALSR